jgi:molecular chaperone HtpG
VLLGDDAKALAVSPQLEGFRARGVEVLLLSDPIDAFWPDRLDGFEGHSIRSVTLGTEELAKIAPDAAPSGEATDVSRLTIVLKEALKEDVSEVRASERLVESAVALAASAGGPDLHMQRLLRRSGRGFPAQVVLEINARHGFIRALAARAEKGEDLADDARLLLDLARVQDGEPPKDPAAFVRRVTAALGSA